MRYVTSALYSRFDHPLLVGLYLLAGVFALFGVLVQQFTASGVAAGFFAVYAIVTAGLATIGYAMIFVVRRLSEIRDGIAPHAS